MADERVFYKEIKIFINSIMTTTVHADLTKQKYTQNTPKNDNKTLYLFSDNMEKRGVYDQAIIRHNENTFGIPIKKKRNNQHVSYFTDWDYNENKKTLDESLEQLNTVIESGDYSRIVFPKEGFGVNSGRLHYKAPKTYKYLKYKMNKLFDSLDKRPKKEYEDNGIKWW